MVVCSFWISDSLLPGERLKASYLVKSVGISTLPIVRVRSNEAIGSPPLAKESKREYGLYSSLSAAAAVLVTILGWAIQSRRSGIAILASAPTSKQTLIRYIAMRAGVVGFNRSPEVVGADLSYLRASDILVGMAHADPGLTYQCSLANQALLLVSNMATDSITLIISNAERMQMTPMDDLASMLRERAVSLSEVVRLRKVIDDFIDNPALFAVNAALKKPRAA